MSGARGAPMKPSTIKRHTKARSQHRLAFALYRDSGTPARPNRAHLSIENSLQLPPHTKSITQHGESPPQQKAPFLPPFSPEVVSKSTYEHHVFKASLDQNLPDVVSLALHCKWPSSHCFGCLRLRFFCTRSMSVRTQCSPRVRRKPYVRSAARCHQESPVMRICISCRSDGCFRHMLYALKE